MDEVTFRRIAQEEAQKIVSQEDTDNQFAVAQTSFHTHNGIDSQKVDYKNIVNAPSYFSLAKDTNGTTNVNVFTSAGAPFRFTITGVFLTSKDTTAGNITVLHNLDTVCTIAKGTTAGVMVGATSLTSTTVNKGDLIQIDSSSAGNATVYITFTI